MNKFLKLNLPIIFLFLSLIAFASSIPTSVLVNTKDEKLKVKRSSNLNSSPQSETPSSTSFSSTNRSLKIPSASTTGLDSNPSSSSSSSSTSSKSTTNVGSDIGIPVDLLLGANQGIPAAGYVSESKSIPKKRGANSQLLYNDIFNTPSSSSSAGSSLNSYTLPNGIWSDEIDPSYLYQDIQDFEDYPRSYYKAKPYDNLQSILNAENMYSSEPVALPSSMQYPFRYYGDRKKRSNKKNNAFDLSSNKRESKLTPADMLALVALVEAGERRQDAENEETLNNNNNNNNNNNYPNDYYPSRLYAPSSLPSSSYGSQYFDEDINNFNDFNTNSNNNANGMGPSSSGWIDPIVDYYGMPYNLDPLRYDAVNEPRLASKYYPSKRFMVSKKKRSLSHFYNEPIAYPSISYSAPSAEFHGKNGPKRYQKYF